MTVKKFSVEFRYEDRVLRVDHDDVIFLKNADGVDTPFPLTVEQKERILAFAAAKRARGQEF